MSMKYGFNIGTSDMKSLLKQNDKQVNGIKSWKQLFSGAAGQYAGQNSAIVSSYSDAIAQAYASNLAQQDAIAAAGLNAGATREMIESNRAALRNAYQTYIQNYGSAVTNNAQNYKNTVDAYDADLTARAENFSKLYNYAYQYLTDELANSSHNDGALTVPVFGTIADPSWLSQNELDWLTETVDNEKRVRSWDSLSYELFNENRELTDKGREFFDAMFNARTDGYTFTDEKGNSRAAMGFDQWLSGTDAELRDWYMQGDAYNYTRNGTNLGTAKQLLGLESTDSIYQARDYKTADELKTAVNTDWFNTDFRSEFAEVEKLYVEMLDATRAWEEVGQYDPRGNMSGTKAAAEGRWNEASNKFNDKWGKAFAAARTSFNNALAQFKHNVGADDYNAFVKKNQELIDSIQNYLSTSPNFTYAEADKFDQLKKNIDKLSEEFAATANAIVANRKVSGF